MVQTSLVLGGNASRSAKTGNNDQQSEVRLRTAQFANKVDKSSRLHGSDNSCSRNVVFQQPGSLPGSMKAVAASSSSYQSCFEQTTLPPPHHLLTARSVAMLMRKEHSAPGNMRRPLASHEQSCSNCPIQPKLSKQARSSTGCKITSWSPSFLVRIHNNITV